MAYGELDKLIFKHMEKQGVTQREVAKYLGIKPQTVHKYKIYGFPEKAKVKMLMLLKIPSKEFSEAIYEDLRR